MIRETTPNHVVAADQDFIKVECAEQKIAKRLIQIGFTREHLSGKQYALQVGSEADKVAVFRKLHSMGFAFSAGQGWSPTELFELYIEQGQISYPYKAITWTGPGKWFVTMVTGLLPVRVLKRSQKLEEEMRLVNKSQQ